MTTPNARTSTDAKAEAYVHDEVPEKMIEGQELATADYSGVRKKTDPKEIRLVRKLDCIMMPMLWIMYFLNYLDRNAITVARLDGMEEDLGLVGNQYLTAVSILFVGYILGQLPATMIMTRVRPSLFMATWMAIWAIVSGLTGIARNYTGLVVTRFFLGVAEAPFYPGALFMLSSFYPKKEIATRISILYTANICGTAFAGLIAIGVFKMEGMAGLEGWRWLFILLGIITFIVSIASAFLLPDEPINTRWLTPEERQLAHDRMAADTVERKANTATMAGLKEAAKDIRLWVLIVMYHFHMAASNFKNFFPTIVETLGYDTNTTLALTCPPYLVSGVITIAWGYSSGRFNERTWHITVSKIVAIFGFVLACTTSNVGARYFAMCCFATGVYACNSVIIGWIASTCGQTKEKKAAAIGMANTIANLSPIYSPYLWPAWNAPRYVIPMVASAAFSFVALVLAWVMRRILVKENRRIRASTTESTLFYPY